ncbi:class I SAM-dependent methyltransferase [Hydrogenophaga palleronii]|uniref:class I SAM-dependent methyltransferase n=1 Tax=Hydrogenophaga palleronii TaxID=65655 RepID=UPI000A04372C|nr:class I SAM-dependent methyltransferase [Hydrogenophaga palleronii]
MEDLDQYARAYEGSFPYARDNHGVLTAYAKQLIGACESVDGLVDICSLGIGYETVSRSLAQNLAKKIRSYTAVEGSRLLIERYKKDADFPFPFELVHGYFETFETERRFDVIEMGFVLEHVDDPALVVQRFSRLLKPGGVICAAVPNALSMHRTLGVRAGLLQDPYALNEWDLQLGHKRYFDRDSFRALFDGLGLSVERETGLMLKPFSTAQMDALNLPESVWDVLFHSGDLAPSYAYGIYAEIRVPQSS